MGADEHDMIMLFGKIGMKLEERGTGHGIVNQTLVPQIGGKNGSQTLGSGRTHAQTGRFLIPQDLATGSRGRARFPGADAPQRTILSRYLGRQTLRRSGYFLFDVRADVEARFAPFRTRLRSRLTHTFRRLKLQLILLVGLFFFFF